MRAGPSRAELERLWRWERVMACFHAAAAATMLAAGGLLLAYAEVVWLRRALLGVILALVAAAGLLKSRARCPSCSAVLKLGAGFLLPARCRACRLPLPRPRREDAGSGTPQP